MKNTHWNQWLCPKVACHYCRVSIQQQVQREGQISLLSDRRMRLRMQFIISISYANLQSDVVSLICNQWSIFRWLQGQTVELFLSLRENFFHHIPFFFFAICLLSLWQDRALLSSLRANCKAFWVGNRYTLGFRLGLTKKLKSSLKTLQFGNLLYELFMVLQGGLGQQKFVHYFLKIYF